MKEALKKTEKDVTMTDLDYKELYEKEVLKCSDLAGKLSELEMKNEELEWNIRRIKENPLWKMTGPLRRCMHWCIRQRDRLRNCGGIKGVFRKIHQKKLEKKAMHELGKKSFPTAEQAERERSTKFPRMVKISILVPLYNTPKEFLSEMIESVTGQTYTNWELCLADGSDADHNYVGEICKAYAAKADGRIVYKKLEKNMGISENTNAHSDTDPHTVSDHTDVNWLAAVISNICHSFLYMCIWRSQFVIPPFFFSGISRIKSGMITIQITPPVSFPSIIGTTIVLSTAFINAKRSPKTAIKGTCRAATYIFPRSSMSLYIFSIGKILNSMITVP